MTAPSYGVRRHDPVPTLDAEHQPHPDVVAAYWDGVALTKLGWSLHKVQFLARDGGAEVSAESPKHLRVKATSGRTHHCAQASTPPGDLLLQRLADGAAELGRHDQRCHTDRLSALQMLLGAHVARKARPVTLSFAPLPGLPRGWQPLPGVRSAVWLMCALSCRYGWHLTDLGTDVAAGGFIADIPGECTAVFPASMPNDGSESALLARAIGRLPCADVSLIETLWAQHLGVCDVAGRS